MNTLRRTLLKSCSALGALCVAGVWQPVWAALEWQAQAFKASRLSEALKAFGVQSSTESRDIVINAAEISENGAQVPVNIVSNIPGSQNMAVFVEKNPLPLAASLRFANGALPVVRLQLKMAETSPVRVVVTTADGKIFHARREIKVTLGGCA
jgi:sulfur-oxidizing protein SoxY